MRPRAVTLAVAALTALAACSGANEPTDLVATTVPPAVAATATEPAAETFAPQSPSATSTRATGPSAAGGELAESLETGSLLAASSQGVELVPPAGAASPERSTIHLTAIPAQRAFSDGAGGIVFQGVAPPQPEAPSAAIMWLPPDGSDAVTIVPDGAADEITLHGAALIDGQPSAYYTARTGAGVPEESEQTLEVIPVSGGEPRAVATVGQWESGVDSVSFGGDTFALNSFREATSWFLFLDTEGVPVDVLANPLPEADPCTDDATCPSLVAIDDDGARLAWARPGELHIAALGGDEPDRTLSLPPPDDGVVSHLAIAENLVVANRFSVAADADGGLEPLTPVIYDLSASDGTPVEAQVPAFTTVVAG